MRILYLFLIKPKFQNKDLARREVILNILLLGGVFLSLAGFILNCVTYCGRFSAYSLIPPVSFSFFTFFVVLLFLSRKGKVLFSALLFVTFLFFSTIAIFLRWGVDVPQGILMLALLIVVSGVLVGSRFAFLVTALIGVSHIVLTYLQVNFLYRPLSSWKNDSVTMGDTILSVCTLSVVAIVAWLSNRETEASLKRARASEVALKKERDLLEIKVEERTKELKEVQMEKVSQIYRFAEIGKLASGLFHDLVTPLSVISFNLERLEKERRQESIEDMKNLVQRALKGAKYLETILIAVRKQLQNQDFKNDFSVRKEIKQVIQMLTHKAKEMTVKIVLDPSPEIKMYGNEIKFSQLISNLLVNAVDAYENSLQEIPREVRVSLHNDEKSVMINIKDKGVGIEAENIKKVFQPFFTTKSTEKGTGIGLSISKDIVEKSFHGKLMVKSNKKMGTVFTITLPLVRRVKEQNGRTKVINGNK
ncbi:HAMP domain-containing histidine kinase [Candidatus Roizmanbacteria bacterium]|nr:HAMP domain-containing histidine kinase [Candidatus Roizmanbacteria bacterium]